MDNASIHKTKSTFERFKDLQMIVYFILSYSPSLAHVELFFKQIKTKFKAQLSRNILRLNNSEERLDLLKIILQLEGDPVKASWREIIRNASSILKNTSN